MTDLPQWVCRVADVRALERAAPGRELMARAGVAALAALRARWPEARRITVVAGPGDNGGDGRVLARLAQKQGMQVAIVESRREGAVPTGTAPTIPPCDVVVDALFGIGLSRAPEGEFAALIDAVNRQPAPVLTLDLPSGLDADSGVAPGAVVRADLTVSFIAYKPGLFNADGPRCCGTVQVAPLDLPTAAYDGITPVATVLDAGLAARWLGSRPRDAHKGQHGHVLVVGGRAGMTGAAQLAATAALRCGAGLVSVALAPGLAARISGAPELMVHEVDGAAALTPLLERASVVALGPGLGTDAWARTVFDAVMADNRPLVADADALNLLAAAPRRRADWVITPHPGEAARLLDSTAAAVQRDRYAAAAALADRTGAVVALKGAATLVAAAGAVPQVCVAGNPGLASGGTGDVLTGVVAALWAQGLDAAHAAAAGVCLHAEAGDLAAAAGGERGLVAGDLLPYLRLRANGRDR